MTAAATAATATAAATAHAHDGRPLYDWFAATADKDGTATALEIGADRYTYAQLRDLAAHLASRLVTACDDRVPRRVGVLASRNLLAYAGYLAVQRLGCSAVPLNPAFPTPRIAMIARAASLTVIIADGGLRQTTDLASDGADRAAGTGGPDGDDATHEPDAADGPDAPQRPDVTAPGEPWTGQVLRVTADDLSAVLSAPPTQGPGPHDSPAPPPVRHPSPNDEAYVLFTSGSTGVPKGVRIKHGNVSSHLRFTIPRYGLGPDCRAADCFELAFDPAVSNMFATWGAGAPRWWFPPAAKSSARHASWRVNASRTGSACPRWPP